MCSGYTKRYNHDKVRENISFFGLICAFFIVKSVKTLF